MNTVLGTSGLTVGQAIITAIAAIVGFIIGRRIENSIKADTGGWIQFMGLIVGGTIALAFVGWIPWVAVISVFIAMIGYIIVANIITANSVNFIQYVIGFVIGGFIGSFFASGTKDPTTRTIIIVVSGFIVSLAITKIASMFQKS